MRPLVIICGLGQIGFRSFEILHAAGFCVSVVTSSTSDDWMQAVLDSGGRVILGDARSDKNLVEAGVRNAIGIIVATDQDIANVSIAMDARRLNASVRIVCRMFDTNLGMHIRESFGVTQVFSTSELAIPTFVEALQEHGLGLGTRGMSGYRLACNAAAVPPIAQISIPRSQSHSNGKPASSLYLCATLGQAESRKKNGVAGKLVGIALSPALMSYWKIGAFIFGVIATSAALLSTALQMSFLDATYFVTTTITTVGYGDYNFSSAPASIKIFGICLMLIGAGSLAVLFSSVTDALFSKRMINAVGGRPVPRRNHLILVGAGHLGSRIAHALINSDVPFVIIENDTMGRYSVDVKRQTSVIDGDPKSSATLDRCNVNDAAAIMTISDDDVENLSAALSAKTANRKLPTIVRVFDPDLGAGLQERLVLDSVISISKNAAPYFVAALVADNVHAAIQLEDSLVFVAEQTAGTLVVSLGSYSATGLPDVVVGAIPLSGISRM